MATSLASTNKFDGNVDDTAVEIFSLIWLDASPVETRNTEKLRAIINHLKKFQDVESCQHFIKNLSKNDRLMMIVSAQLGREIVPEIHGLQQVISIYVYCKNQKGAEKWASKYKKVKAILTDSDKLIASIKDDYEIQRVVQEPFSIHTFSTNDAGSSTTGVNGQFVYSQVLIDCLLRLQPSAADKKELMDYCMQQYAGNAEEIRTLCEFQQSYSSTKVLWWYTRESFFYKILNATLRKQNIRLMFLFRTFISDIFYQLKKYQATNMLRVYRAQMISKEEFENLKKCSGQLISINSFFSTSLNKQDALSFLDPSTVTENLIPILFTIDADPDKASSKPFADISQYSYYPEEKEILFMLGSIFRLESVQWNDKDTAWIIHMTLYDDNKHKLAEVLADMKKQLGDGETNLHTLGKLLWTMGKSDLAEEYFVRLLNMSSSNKQLSLNLCEDLAQIASIKYNLDKAIEWRQKALEFKQQLKLSKSDTLI